jgi:CysZ protein
MLFGLLPGLVALILLVAALVPLFWNLGDLATFLTPFADGWSHGWRIAVRIGAGVAIAAAALVLCWVTFTALALAIGDPFYQRIWSAVETDLGENPGEQSSSLPHTVAESLKLVLLGVLTSMLTVLLGLIPAIGGVLAAMTGVSITGWLLARELTDRAFDARNLPASRRAGLRRRSRARTWGFGVATQLCFLIPLGALLTMPVAVAGSTILARDLLERDADARGAHVQEEFH